MDDHKFRSTTITRWLRSGRDVPTVMAWVGHTEPETILRYAAKVKARLAETVQQSGAPFAQFACVGD